nr:WYL domain-containing protein [Halomonas sp. Mc5H-6]
MYVYLATESKKDLTLHPQGIVSRHSVNYLIAQVDGFGDLQQFALHRITDAAMSDVPWEPTGGGSYIDAYIQVGAFDYRHELDYVMLDAEIAHSVAWLLQETPLAKSQTIKPLGDKTYHLTAHVPTDQQTLWWLMGMGANVKVFKPASWRKALKDNAKQVLAYYYDVDNPTTPSG